MSLRTSVRDASYKMCSRSDLMAPDVDPAMPPTNMSPTEIISKTLKKRTHGFVWRSTSCVLPLGKGGADGAGAAAPHG